LLLNKNGTQMTSQSLAAEVGAGDQGIASAAFSIGSDVMEFFCLLFVHALLVGDGLTASIGPPIYRAMTILRPPLSTPLIRELAGVLPRRRHFPLLQGAMRLIPAAGLTGRQS
jgi:hypothetical protein